MARAEADGPWQFLGVLPLFDPPREDAKETIETASQDGCQDQDGYRRCIGHCYRNRQEIRDGYKYS